MCLCHHVDSDLAQGRAASFLLAKGAATENPDEQTAKQKLSL